MLQLSGIIIAVITVITCPPITRNLIDCVAPLGCCICEKVIEESSWAQASRHGPEGREKAARQFTIATQQGEGDWKTSIREAGMDVKWLGPISRECIDPGQAFMNWRNKWWQGPRRAAVEEEAAGSPEMLSAQYKSQLKLQLNCRQKHQTKMWFN